MLIGPALPALLCCCRSAVVHHAHTVVDKTACQIIQMAPQRSKIPGQRVSNLEKRIQTLLHRWDGGWSAGSRHGFSLLATCQSDTRMGRLGNIKHNILRKINSDTQIAQLSTKPSTTNPYGSRAVENLLAACSRLEKEIPNPLPMGYGFSLQVNWLLTRG